MLRNKIKIVNIKGVVMKKEKRINYNKKNLKGNVFKGVTKEMIFFSTLCLIYGIIATFMTFTGVFIGILGTIFPGSFGLMYFLKYVPNNKDELEITDGKNVYLNGRKIDVIGYNLGRTVLGAIKTKGTIYIQTRDEGEILFVPEQKPYYPSNEISIVAEEERVSRKLYEIADVFDDSDIPKIRFSSLRWIYMCHSIMVLVPLFIFIIVLFKYGNRKTGFMQLW